MRALPAALGGAALLVVAALLWANVLLWGGTLAFGKPLDGVVPPLKPDWSVHAILRGLPQWEVQKAVAPLVPIQRAAVRLKNQLWWTLFHTPGQPFLAANQAGVLSETNYLHELCARDPVRFVRRAEAWLPQLRRMQDLVEARGQRFLYVVTPSKVAFDPAAVPKTYSCPSTPADRAAILPLWLGMLHRAGIHAADAVSPLYQARTDYPVPMFPRGGTHWNMIGAALGARAVVAALPDLLAPVAFTYAVTDRPEYPDDDLARLMNLRRPQDRFPVPAVRFQQVPPATPCRPDERIAIVGGSFMLQIGQVLSAGACRPRVDEWEYWRGNHLAWPVPGVIWSIATPGEAARTEGLNRATAVIYEENEEMLANTEHGPAFLAWLEAGRP